MTRKFIPTWIAAAALALSAAAAHAQTSAPAQASPTAQAAPADARGHHPHARHHGKRLDPAQRAERQAQRVAEFKQKLNLTPAQQAAWTQYQAATQPPARPAREAGQKGREGKKAGREAWAAMTTPQRIDAMQQRHAEMSARMQARGEATKAFYAQLQPAQQKVFDAETARGFGPGAHGHGPRGHGHHDGAKRQPAPPAPAK